MTRGQAPAPAQLPPDTADFTGRRAQVRLLCGLLGAQPVAARPGAVVISAVAGMGGILDRLDEAGDPRAARMRQQIAGADAQPPPRS